MRGDQRRLDAGGDDRDADDAVEALVEGGAQDDVGVRIDLLSDARGGLVELVQGEVVAARDRDQQAARTLHRDIVEERVGDGGFRSPVGALLAGSLAGAHHGLAHAAHDRADVGEVEVDQAFLDHQVGDAGDARVEHLVGHREGVREGRLLVGDPEQVLVRDHDQGVDGGLQLLDSGLGGAHPAHALELERLRHDADREDAHVAGRAGDDGGRTGAGAAAHAGRDEAHVSARELVTDLVDHLLGGGRADLGMRAGTEALRHAEAHLDDALGLRRGQRLRVGIGDDELAAEKTGLDHVVDGVAARAADTEDGDAGLEFPDVRRLQRNGHDVEPLVTFGFVSGVQCRRRCLRFTRAPRGDRA
ncbi:hypothetical protein AEGHOMDF_2820 [Methylobacterium soli]|nr:hypothetical protein AEGHOMDF_2820 [Methylobacterium soli]